MVVSLHENARTTPKIRAEIAVSSKSAKTFNAYEPGFARNDVKYLPQVADEPHRRYLFVTIDRDESMSPSRPTASTAPKIRS